MEDENDRRWQQVTLDVASQVGLDEDNWQSALMKYEHLKVTDANLTEDDLRARAMDHFGGQIDANQFNRAMDIYQRDYGNAKAQQAAAMGMQEDQFARTIDAMTRQESRENSTWNGILGTTPLNLGLDRLFSDFNEDTAAVFSQTADEQLSAFNEQLAGLGGALDVGLEIDKRTLGDGVDNAMIVITGTNQLGQREKQRVSFADLRDNGLVQVGDLNIAKVSDVDISDYLDFNQLASILQAPTSEAGERLTPREVYANERAAGRGDEWLATQSESLYNTRLDSDQIAAIKAGTPVTIQPAPRDFLQRFKDPEQLNAIMGWVAGVSPFTQEMGVWEAVGQFAGAATVAGASAYLGRPQKTK